MAFFLTREEPTRGGGGKRCSYSSGASPYLDPGNAASHPGSPLSRLVQDGYLGKKGGGHPAPQGFIEPQMLDVAAMQQRANNVRDGYSNHAGGRTSPAEACPAAQQQENDPPAFGQMKPKTEGRKHLAAANGQNSLSLAWDDGAVEQPARRGRGGAVKECQSNDVLGTDPPRHVAAARETDDMPRGLGDAAYAQPASASRLPNGNRNVAPPPSINKPPQKANIKPPPRKSPEPMESYGIASTGSGHGGLSQQEAYALAANRERGGGKSGGHVGGGNSYGGANGNGGQNTGNMLGNRNSSRVLAPPGGFSSFQLG